jgi:hypothetical protein
MRDIAFSVKQEFAAQKNETDMSRDREGRPSAIPSKRKWRDLRNILYLRANLDMTSSILDAVGRDRR